MAISEFDRIDIQECLSVNYHNKYNFFPFIIFTFYFH